MGNVQTYTHVSLPTSKISNGKYADANIQLGDGDGTVFLAGSLDVCDRWPSTHKSYRIPGVAHAQMLHVGQTLDIIIAVATEQHEFLENWLPPTFGELELLAGTY